jgi:ferredoxin
MKVRLDAEACVGHGRCYALAPELFDADDQGHCAAQGTNGPFESLEVPVGLEAKARTAVANCPEDALSVE